MQVVQFLFSIFFIQIATLRAFYYNTNNISEINCQTGVRSNVLFEQERGWMEVVSIYWTVSQLLGQFLRAPSSQGLIYLVIYLCLCLYLQDKTTRCKKERPDNTLQKDVREKMVCPQLLVSEPRQRQRLGSKLKAAFILSIHLKSLHGELKAAWRVPQVVFVRD